MSGNDADSPVNGPLLALLDALERRRALFWTGHVLVEFKGDYVPSGGQVTMVLDENDVAVLMALRSALDADAPQVPPPDHGAPPDQLTVMDKLGGLTFEEASVLAQKSLNDAAVFQERAHAEPDGRWLEFAEWKKGRARLFKQMEAEESKAQDEYHRQRTAQLRREL